MQPTGCPRWWPSAPWSPRSRWARWCTCCTRTRPDGCRAAPRALVVAAGYVVCLVLQVPLYLFAAATRAVRPAGRRRPAGPAGRSARSVQSVAGAAVMVATIDHPGPPAAAGRAADDVGPGSPVRVRDPRRAVHPGQRRACSTARRAVAGRGLRRCSSSSVAGVPVAFTLGLLRGGFARTGEIEELGRLVESARSPGAYRSPAALSRALGDDSVAAASSGCPNASSYVDANGDSRRAAAGDRARAGRRSSGTASGSGPSTTTAPCIADPDAGPLRRPVIADRRRPRAVTAELRASQQDAATLPGADRRGRRPRAPADRPRPARRAAGAVSCCWPCRRSRSPRTPHAPPRSRDAALDLRVGVDAAAAELRVSCTPSCPPPLIERGLCAATEDLVDHAARPDHAGHGRRRAAAARGGGEHRLLRGRRSADQRAQARPAAQPLTVRLAPRRRPAAGRGERRRDRRRPHPAAGSGLRGLVDRVDDARRPAARSISPPEPGTQRRRGAAVRIVIGEDESLLRQGLDAPARAGRAPGGRDRRATPRS